MNNFQKINKMKDKQDKQDMKKLIKKTKDDILLNAKDICPYCNSEVSLYNLKNQHFKSIKCKQMKKLYYQDPKNAENSEHYILMQINELIKDTLNDAYTHANP